MNQFFLSPSYKSLLSETPPLLLPLPVSCNPIFNDSSSPSFVSVDTPLNPGTPLTSSSSPSSILVDSLPIPLLADQSPSISIDHPDVLPNQSSSMSVDQPFVMPDQPNSLSIAQPLVLPA